MDLELVKGHWPWWVGAPALAVVAVGYAASSGSLLGVSSVYARLVRVRKELARGREESTDASARSSWPPLSAHLLFLVMIFAGGLLAKVLTPGEGLGVTASPDPAHAALFGSGWRGALALVAGGAMVGFGTRLAGGCTSGHGLSGCSRFQPGSLLATACFFGTGVLVSFVLARVLS
jgi:uncharacterized membrane protein YedE/YeeE